MIRKILSLTLLLAVISCATDKKSNINAGFTIQSPMSSIEILPEKLTYLPEKDTVIYLTDGSVLSIPSNCFVDKNGKEIKDSVQIDYTLYSTLAEIFISGIPMSYDSAGVKENFESAGMFKIEGSVKNEEVFFAAGKKITVSVPSNEKDDNYKFYALDEKGKWNYKNNLTPFANPKKEQRKKELESSPKNFVKPIVESKKVEVFDIDVSYGEFAEMKAFKNVLWTCVNTSEKSKNKAILAKQWGNIKLKRSDLIGAFILQLSTSTDNAELLVQPVFAKKDYEKAMQAFNKLAVDYDAKLEDRIRKDEVYASHSSFIRNVQISSFGIFNCDRYSREPDFYVMDLNLELPKGTKFKKEDLNYYLFEDAKNMTAVSFSELKSLRFFPKKKNLLVCVLEGDKIAFFNQFPSEDKKVVQSQLNLYSKTASSAVELQSIIQGLY